MPTDNCYDHRNGIGYGNGYKHGDGYGSGNCYGYGDGYGKGYIHDEDDNFGTGIGESDNKEFVAAICKEKAKQVGFSDDKATLAIWKSDLDGRPTNGGRGTIARVGLRERIPGPLKLCTPNALHATLNPWYWSGDRMWLVALRGEVKTQDDKLGSLDREIVAEFNFVL